MPFIVYLLFVGLGLSTCPSALQAKEKKKKEQHLVKSLANEYMRAFAVYDEDGEPADQPETIQPPEIVSYSYSTDTQYITVNIPLIGGLGEMVKYKIAFNLLDLHINQGKLPIQKTIDKTFVRSMELVSGGSEGKNSLVRDINYSPGIITETALVWACAQPSPDYNFVKHNQTIIKELENNKELFSALYGRVQKLAVLEENLFSFFTTTDTAFFKTIQMAQFYPLFGKTSPTAMGFNSGAEKVRFIFGGSIAAILTTAAATAIIVGAIEKDPGIAFGVGGVLSLFGLGMGFVIHSNLQITKKVICHLHQRMIKLASYINTLREIYEIVNTHPTLKNHFPHLRYLSKLFEHRMSDNTKNLLNLLQSDTFRGSPAYWSSYNGRTLVAYALLQEVKFELCDAIMAGGQLGALVSVTRLYLDHQDTPAHYSFVEFVGGDRPYISATNLWNPRLDKTKAVPSSFEMGGASPYNIVLTGGNGLGKSTIMKGLLYAMLIAQTFGIAPADRLVMTPFARMICHGNISDNVAAGLSGFTAELAMKDAILKEYTLLKPNEFAITVFDELFKSTNPDDAAQLSKQLCRSLAQYKNGMSIIATHLAPVTELEAEGTHANYHPGSIPQGEGKPAKPTYTLEKGASFDHNAVALYNAGK